MNKSKHKTSAQLQKETDEAISTFKDFIDYLEDYKPLEGDEDIQQDMIKYFEAEIANMNGAENALRWYITKDKAEAFLKWEAKQPTNKIVIGI